MISARQRSWWIFAACTTALVAVMVWVSCVVVQLEEGEAEARAHAEHQTNVRLAMWRVDSWLAPLLAREAARPYYDYQSYYPQQTAYTKILGQIAPGEVLTPSPLLTFRSELFPLHFECDALGQLTSPQVPTSNARDLAEASLPAAEFERSTAALENLRRFVRLEDFAAKMGAAEVRMVELGCVTAMQPPPPDPSQSEFGQNEYQSRAQRTNFAKQPGAAVQGQWMAVDNVEIGPLLPIWLDDPSTGEAQLVFTRRVAARGAAFYQGIVADWPRLSAAMTNQLSDVFPVESVALARVDQPTAEQEPQMLATVPALLTVPAPAAPRPSWSPTRSILVAAWLAMVLAVVAVGVTLSSTMALGERRARFASAVTHELRTPLTTFRMYSEMLADDMVVDPAQRGAYLATLKNESDRLSRLVENVLCYARLEDGRYSGRRETLDVPSLLERVTPLLRQRAADAGMELGVTDRAGDTRVEIDVDAVTQILFNLVDNGSKYASGSEPAAIDLEVAAEEDAIVLSVRDHGPGVPAEHQRAIFRPFERGARAAGDNAYPGVGLGLALARGLARDLGGDLELDTSVSPGARFVLRLPRAS